MTLMNVTLMTGFRDWKMTLNDIDWTHSMTFGPVSSSCKRYIAFCHDALNEILLGIQGLKKALVVTPKGHFLLFSSFLFAIKIFFCNFALLFKYSRCKDNKYF